MIACSVEKRVSLVNKLTPSQRFTFYKTEMEGMLRIRSVKMRDNLFALMIQGFNLSTKKFMVQQAAGKKGLISLRPDNVFAIFGLKNEGVDVSCFLSMDQGKAVKKVPVSFVNKKTGKILIDDLIQKIVRNKNADDEFVQMAFLVLLGTIIAPVSDEYISKNYYALVQDVRQIKKFNWNAFTLRFCLPEIGMDLQPGRVREWPRGNLALLQV